MTEEMVDAALGDLDDADLPSRTVAALRLADELTEPRPSVDDDLMALLRSEFDDDEILELGAALAVASGWQRFIEAFGIRPDQWNEGTALPW
jgi:alkylhydroperoxidase family enzyme